MHSLESPVVHRNRATLTPSIARFVSDSWASYLLSVNALHWCVELR